MGADDVGVSLDDDHGAGLTDGGTSQIESVEQIALAEEVRIGRVDVFCRLADRRPTAEADGLATGVADWEDEAIPESIPGSVVCAQDQPRRHCIIEMNTASRQMVDQRVGLRTGQAQVELLRRLLGDASLAQIVLRVSAAGSVLQLVAPVVERGVVRSQQSLALLVLTDLFVGSRSKLDPCALRQALQGLAEVDVVALHLPAEDVATLGTGAETVPGLAIWVDDERGRLLGVKRAGRLVRRPAPLEGDLGGDQIDDVDLRLDLFH